MVFCKECGTEIDDNAKFCSECGAEIIFKENEPNKENILESTIRCPSCNSINYRDQVSCSNCGRDLSNTLGYFEGGTRFNVIMNRNIEITPSELIVYKRSKIGGKSKKNPKRYNRDEMESIELHRHLHQLRFMYNGKLEFYSVLPKYYDELKRILKIGHKYEQVSGGMLKEAKGVNGQLELYEHKVIIRRKGKLALLTQGLKGDKEILISQISSIQFKKPRTTNGYIQFAFLGGFEAKRGIFQATEDENTVVFSKARQHDFEVIKSMIEEKMMEQQGLRTSIPNSKPVMDYDELEKLAELKDKGIITEDEFRAKKKQILGL